MLGSHRVTGSPGHRVTGLARSFTHRWVILLFVTLLVEVDDVELRVQPVQAT